MTDPDDIDLPDDWQYDLTLPEWHRVVVDVIDETRARAMRGDVTSVALTFVRRNGAVSTVFAGGPGGRQLLIAGAHHLLARLVAE